MKYLAAIGCSTAFLDAVGYALELTPQTLYGAGYEWIWWLSAIGWLAVVVWCLRVREA